VADHGSLPVTAGERKAVYIVMMMWAMIAGYVEFAL
jgi:hypothetical protein